MVETGKQRSNHFLIPDKAINIQRNKPFYDLDKRSYINFFQNCQNSIALCMKTYKELKTA